MEKTAYEDSDLFTLTRRGSLHYTKPLCAADPGGIHFLGASLL